MSLYVLDTDHLSLYRYGHNEVSARLEVTPADQLAVTIITIEEQLRAWYTRFVKPGMQRIWRVPTKAYSRSQKPLNSSGCCRSRVQPLSGTWS